MPFDDTTLEKLRADHGELVVFDEEGIALRAFTAPQFDAYFDERGAQGATAEWNVVLRQLVAPSAAELMQKRDMAPGLPKALAKGLAAWAGSSEDIEPREDDLTSSTPAGVLEAGHLSREDADALVAKFPSSRLVLVVDDELGVSVVVRSPYSDDITNLNAQIASGKKVATALRRAARDHVVWSSLPAEDLFKTYPAFPAAAIAPVVLRLGGAGSEARFRRRPRADRRPR